MLPLLHRCLLLVQMRAVFSFSAQPRDQNSRPQAPRTILFLDRDQRIRGAEVEGLPNQGRARCRRSLCCRPVFCDQRAARDTTVVSPYRLERQHGFYPAKPEVMFANGDLQPEESCGANFALLEPGVHGQRARSPIWGAKGCKSDMTMSANGNTAPTTKNLVRTPTGCAILCLGSRVCGQL